MQPHPSTVLSEARLKQMSSPELVDLAASLGFGEPFKGEKDPRTASLNETGIYTATRMRFAQIKVRNPAGPVHSYAMWVFVSA